MTDPAAPSGFMTLKQLPLFVLARYNTEVSERTLRRWRKKHNFPLPTTPETFGPWFEARMRDKQRSNSRRKFGGHHTDKIRPA